jgi:transposase
MKAKQQGEKKARKQYSAEFKEQALKRAEKDGVAAAARDLGLAESQIYGWRQRRRLEGLTTEEQKLQHAELARLKRELARVEEENAFLKKATAYFAKQSK